MAGEDFTQARKMVLAACLKRYQQVFPRVTKEQVLLIIDPWARVRRKGPSRYTDQIRTSVALHNEEDSAYWRQQIDSIRPALPTTRLGTLDLSAPASVINALTNFVCTEARLGKAVARQLVEEVITLRNVCCPRTRQLQSGEMPLLTTHVRAHLSEEVATRFRRQAPVILTVWTPEELANCPHTVPDYLELLKKRIVRVCFEAHRQNGLLTLMELQWIFQMSSVRISELICSFEKDHNLVVPTPGTVLDAGRSITHKEVVVSLHLQGYTVKEIARITHHSPRAVDNYVGTFEAVLILYLFGMPPHLMTRLLRKGITLVKEHLELVKEFYRDQQEIRKYLVAKGVRI
ncbi:hypothetical protein HKBW3S03_01357 [Candidatus Hakubella thermalkaliphila]|uniref:DUF1670 domain-containing protein n=2 Tax=Candidatus Hakubella thermalkaliphila TaxID=2754717 RepID=A0A6V8QHV1_9ACTN|nr:DUF1670 domain-containing protein [Candidatus Hakubella thermalkaliphila]GFP19853.1 hypothetical protein HKBW3S03_01357 [Candidatus Hakubella thermalkaliphila]GFP23248.1 hypothetical protein HKBW3S09_00715 [Candidatus Hakubella thermalkaliphila]GFP30994.1 hypothetical protein HKBW3S34_01913 [Candidatus Hakubella thermalkaliphila]GFP40436.1 hypothetical protein HKBW3S47_02132 [Candidatus Hakubella thermalkaliphila]GFP42996.1 hypothetical protein HKBW3C_02128 [Candidatus Hakubella thermalkali